MAWKFYLAESYTSGMPNIGELHMASNRRLESMLNRPGSFSFTVPISHELSQEIDPVKTCIKIYRDSDIIWSGPVWTRSLDLAADKMSVGAVGWFALLNMREMQFNLTWTDEDAGDIAIDLLNHANAQTNSIGTVYGTTITPGTVEATQLRTRNVLKGQKIGPEIQRLSDIESGFDFAIDPETKELNIYEQLMTDRPEVQFGYGWPPNNVSNAMLDDDASQLENKSVVTGRPGAAAGVSFDDASIAEYRIFQNTTALSDVGDEEILQAYANIQTIVYGRPLLLYRITPDPTSIFKAFSDYFVGDKVYFSLRKSGLADVNKQAVRLFGLRMSWDENGNERIEELQTVASS